MNEALLARFQHYVEAERLWKKGQRWLLAVSGGLDSVVLAHLCVQSGIDCKIAHCNFQLRGEESDRDEQFVRELAQKYGLSFELAGFDTARYASERKVSLQVAARDLRYAWFRTFLEEDVPVGERVDAIATAHHQDDNIETLLMNFFRGTGITGLRGIRPMRDNIVRPLLFAGREEIEQYAKEHKLTHVEDSSNATDKYNRNFIRHRVIPLLEERYPEIRQNLAENLSRFRDLEVLYRQAIGRQLDHLMVSKSKGEWHISLVKLGKIHPADAVLYELLKPYGFSPAQAVEVRALGSSTPGHWVASATHRVIRDRNKLILTGLETVDAEQVPVDAGQEVVAFPGGRLLLGHTASKNGSPAENTNPLVACLDAGEISFPLMLRRWKPGDYFYPLGMRKKKKLARFFIDAKLSLADKEKVWVLESNGRIVWVLGLRMDDRCKVVPSTTDFLCLEWQPKAG